MNFSCKWIAMVVSAAMSVACYGLVSHADDQPGDGSKGAEESSAVVEQPSELSVPPLDQVDYPLDRPNWIDEHRVPIPPAQGDDLLISVSSGPAASPEVAAEMMEVMARGAVENYLEQLAHDGPEIIPAEQLQVDMDWVRDELISRRYDGTVGGSDEARYESACLLRISEAEQRKLAQSIQNYRLQGRLSTIGAVALIGFASLVGGSVGLGWLASREQSKKTATNQPPV